MFVRNFNMTLAASGTLEAGAKYQYLRTIVCREALRKFDSFFYDVEGTETLNVDYTIRGLSQYSSYINYISKQKRTMCRGIKKLRSITVRRYAAHLIDLNEYLVFFLEATLTDKISVTK